MIKGYERAPMLEPADSDHVQWLPAILCGLIAGLIFLIVPSGSPWSRIIFLAPVVMGRVIPPQTGLPASAVWVIHMAVSVAYGLAISFVAARFRRTKTLVAGALAGLVLYAINLGIISAFWPSLRGHEVAVAFAHVVFGAIAAGAYRGLLKRKMTGAVPGGAPP